MKDNSLVFAAGLVGGMALGLAVASRRRQNWRRYLKDRSREGIEGLRDLADTGSAALTRQQKALRNAFEAGRRSYMKTAS
jgi:hypothetical protein